MRNATRIAPIDSNRLGVVHGLALVVADREVDQEAVYMVVDPSSLQHLAAFRAALLLSLTHTAAFG